MPDICQKFPFLTKYFDDKVQHTRPMQASRAMHLDQSRYLHRRKGPSTSPRGVRHTVAHCFSFTYQMRLEYTTVYRCRWHAFPLINENSYGYDISNFILRSSCAPCRIGLFTECSKITFWIQNDDFHWELKIFYHNFFIFNIDLLMEFDKTYCADGSFQD